MPALLTGGSPAHRQRPPLLAPIVIGAAETSNALARAYALVDEHVGVVHQLVVHEIGPADPPFFYATAQLASTAEFSDVRASALNGGAGWDASTAMMAALGEAMERYGIALYAEADLVRGSYEDLQRDAIDPRRFVFFAEEQYGWRDFPYTRVDPTAPLSWVAGTSLVDGRERLLPAARVYTPYKAPRHAELIMQSTSTGAACHVDRDHAILSALYECIERDAFTIAWLNRLALPEISLADVRDDQLDHARRLLADRGLEPVLLDATSDLACPTVVCVLHGHGDDTPAVAFGAATRGTLRAAARKALVESAHTWFWIHTRCLEHGMASFRDDYTDVRTLDKHSLLYGHPRMRDRVAFLQDDVPDAVRRFKAWTHAAAASTDTSPAAELKRCVQNLARAGLDAVVVDVTPDDVRELGFVVVRVAVPDLHPLWGGHHVRCLGGTRVRTVPVTMGYFATERRAADLNHDPHPMP
jgi:ribosomal protein S12 methylthiotransferase accessory factor